MAHLEWALAALFAIALPSATFPQSTDSPVACHEAARQVERGKLRIAQENFSAAIEDFRSALELCPERRSTVLELAQAYSGARRFGEAEQAAKQFLTGNPRSEEGQFLLAYSYFMQERFREAGKTLRKLLDQDNRNPDAHKLMGLTLFFYREYVLAQAELLTALRDRPNDEEILYYLGRVYSTQNNFGPAVKALKRLLALNPKSYKALDNLGLCYEALGQTENARVAFESAQAIARDVDPTYDWPYANLAEMLVKENRAREALPHAQEAVRVNPRSARNHFLLGKVLARGGEMEDSLEHLLKAVELDPSYAEPHYLLGRLYQKSGQREEAAREFALFEKISKQTPHKRH
ncbi:MAG: tetratricopeptide repeat protein [Acidobacteria bacterium]|nr:tetratricopeptide repeat protein [Acidobacteriota bacterium]